MSGRHFPFWFAAFLFLLQSSVSATGKQRAVPLLRDPGPETPQLYISPVKYDSTLLGPVGVSTPTIHESQTARAPWYIAQWNNPTPWTEQNLKGKTYQNSTPPSSLCNHTAGVALWSIESSHARVCVNSRNGSSMSVELASSGGSVLRCGKEFDLFLSPLDTAYPKYQPQNFVPRNEHELPLSNATKIMVQFEIELNFLTVSARCGTFPQCSATPDYGYLTLGIPLSNEMAKQTIFLQFGIFDSRRKDCGANVDMCSTDFVPRWYFNTLPTLGVNIPAAAIAGGSCLRKAGDKSSMKMDVLPSMKKVVAEAHRLFNASGNLEDWRANSLYLGQGLQGSTTMTTTVTGVELTYFGWI